MRTALNAVERMIVGLLGEAWNAFLPLPHQSADDVAAFRHGIHALQDQALARPMRPELDAARRQSDAIDPDLEREARRMSDRLGFTQPEIPMRPFDVDVPMPAGTKTPPVHYASPFKLGQLVFVGHDDATRAQVTGILWKEELPQVEVSWMNNGTLNAVWVSPRILRAVDDTTGAGRLTITKDAL